MNTPLPFQNKKDILNLENKLEQEKLIKDGLVIESMGCGGNWNNKLIQKYSSICTISANNQELGIGAPTGSNKYGTLITLNPRKLVEENYSITQMYIPSNPERNGIYVRKNSRDWLHINGSMVKAIT